MLRQVIAEMLGIALAVGSAPDSMVTTYVPNGGWLLDDSDGRCSVGRQFSTTDTDLRVNQSVVPRQNSASLIFQSSRPFKSAKAAGVAQVEFGIPAIKIDVPYQSWRSSETGRFTLALKITREQWQKVAAAPQIKIAIAVTARFVIASDLPSIALLQIAKCEDRLLDRVGFLRNPSEGPVAEDARMDPSSTGNWITREDLPRGIQHGRVVIGWIIGANGLIENCRAIANVDVPPMSTAACAALTKRAKYIPAKDEGGRPVRSFGSRVIFLK